MFTTSKRSTVCIYVNYPKKKKKTLNTEFYLLQLNKIENKFLQFYLSTSLFNTHFRPRYAIVTCYFLTVYKYTHWFYFPLSIYLHTERGLYIGYFNYSQNTILQILYSYFRTRLPSPIYVRARLPQPYVIYFRKYNHMRR